MNMTQTMIVFSIGTQIIATRKRANYMMIHCNNDSDEAYDCMTLSVNENC